MADVLTVPKRRFSLEEPFLPPDDCNPLALTNTVDGAPPRLATKVTVWYDDEHLNVLFVSADDQIVATMREHDAPLYQEDVVEVFLAPAALTRYFEIEVNPLGATFDAVVDSPDGDRATMTVDLSWECTNMFTAVRIDRRGAELTVETLIRIPFASLGRSTPVPGEVWRANFYRIDRSAGRDQFSAWRPTLQSPPNFHVPAAFGSLQFASSESV